MQRNRVIVLGVAAVALVVALLLVLGRHGTPTYQQGYTYGSQYMSTGSGNLVVPFSFLPKVCNGIAVSNPYGVPGAPGAHPGSAWLDGCEDAIRATQNFDPPQ